MLLALSPLRLSGPSPPPIIPANPRVKRVDSDRGQHTRETPTIQRVDFGGLAVRRGQGWLLIGLAVRRGHLRGLGVKTGGGVYQIPPRYLRLENHANVMLENLPGTRRALAFFAGTAPGWRCGPRVGVVLAWVSIRVGVQCVTVRMVESQHSGHRSAFAVDCLGGGNRVFEGGRGGTKCVASSSAATC